MVYQRERLAALAVDLVRRQPRMTLAEASEKLGVHRHTLQRALKASGRSFTHIKRVVVLERLGRGLDGARAVALKQIWVELGFGSASSFARYVRRATGKPPSALWQPGPLCDKKG